jgi:hypothetical protein
MSPRFFIRTLKTSDDVILWPLTHHQNDREFSGVWAHPTDTVLVFTQDNFSKPFTFHNGPVGGVGTPIQLILWGAWWTDTDDGRQRAEKAQRWTRGLLDSHYFDELRQYHIARPPVWRGDALCVTEPAPPGTVDWKEANEQVVDMIDNLIDDGVLPDPDDGPRIAHIVLMPPGFTCTDASGSHSSDYDIDFPFDSDVFWAGWCRYFDPDVEEIEPMMQTVSHEIVELLTDPEYDGWRTDVEDDDSPEIADVAVYSNDAGTHKLGAWVNGVRVQAYYSNKHSACVIPIDRDYGARITGEVTERSRTVTDRGTFRPGASDSAACSPSLPECCIDDRDYVWFTYAVDEHVRLFADTQRYWQPNVRWFVNDKPVNGNGTIDLNLDYDAFDGRDTVTHTGTLTVHFEETGIFLDLSAPDQAANFDLRVRAVVEEVDIEGDVVSAIPSTAEVTVGIIGAVLEIEQDYIDQRSACWTAMLRPYTKDHLITGRPWRQEGINYRVDLLTLEIPCYARVSQYDQARRVATLAYAATQTLDSEQAHVFIDGLVASVPVLASAVKRRVTASLEDEQL